MLVADPLTFEGTASKERMLLQILRPALAHVPHEPRGAAGLLAAAGRPRGSQPGAAQLGVPQLLMCRRRQPAREAAAIRALSTR